MHWFGPPRAVKLASPWPWLDHPASGLIRATNRPFRTRFRYGCGPKALNLATQINSPDHYAKGTPSHGPCGHGAPTACKHTVSGTISLLSQRCLSPFPHGTSALSVAREYLALESGLLSFRRGFTCPALLVPALVAPAGCRIRGYHPLWPDFPDRFARVTRLIATGLLRFRSPLLSESRLMSVPRATEMFQFARFAS